MLLLRVRDVEESVIVLFPPVEVIFPVIELVPPEKLISLTAL